uniref:Uncharacterized protein n=1 Tax=Cannabis sativa TaxID=3483 RepID=A0A803QZC5_CANSA
MKIVLVPKVIEDPLQVIVSLLGVIWSLGKLRSKMLCLDPMQNKNIKLRHNLCEVKWIHQLLTEVGFKTSVPVKLCCNNQDTLDIASNLVFHE